MLRFAWTSRVAPGEIGRVRAWAAASNSPPGNHSADECGRPIAEAILHFLDARAPEYPSVEALRDFGFENRSSKQIEGEGSSLRLPLATRAGHPVTREKVFLTRGRVTIRQLVEEAVEATARNPLHASFVASSHRWRNRSRAV